MRIPGVTVFCLRQPCSSHNYLTQISPVNGGLIGAKYKKCDMKPSSADHQSSEAKDLVVFDILRESKCADCVSVSCGVVVG